MHITMIMQVRRASCDAMCVYNARQVGARFDGEPSEGSMKKKANQRFFHRTR